MLGPELQRVVDAALREGESVRFVTRGRRLYPGERIVAGKELARLNQLQIGLTDQRLLLVHCDNDGTPGSYVNAIPLGRIRTGCSCDAVGSGSVGVFASLWIALIGLRRGRGRFSFPRPR